MCEKFLIINLNMFANEHPVYLVSPCENKEIGNFSIETLPLDINILAKENDVHEVRIIGAKQYAPLVEFGIKQTEMTKYNKNELNVEVI